MTLISSSDVPLIRRMNETVLHYLQTRRSTSLTLLDAPAPSADEMATLIATATRVPDHGKLNPWYFITFEGEARADFGQHVRHAYEKAHPDATQAQCDHEAARLTRAPLVIAVIARLRPSTIPAWEQFLSAGIVCHTLCMTAQAMGYGANWLSEWLSTNADIRAAMGLEDARDHIAGFIYIGTATGAPKERDRPDPTTLINQWGGTMDNKGDQYDRKGLDIIKNGLLF